MNPLKPRVLQESIYVSREVMNGLRTLAVLYGAGASEDVQAISPDQLADEMLRKGLDAIPGMNERKAAVRRALDAVAREHPISLPETSK
jgi:hypothetical protein